VAQSIALCCNLEIYSAVLLRSLQEIEPIEDDDIIEAIAMAYEAELGELRTGFADFRAKDNAVSPASARSDDPKPAKKAHLTKEEDNSSDTDDSDSDDDDDDDASGPYDHAFAPLLAANASRRPAQVCRVELRGCTRTAYAFSFSPRRVGW
jgi:hypothetical protein